MTLYDLPWDTILEVLGFSVGILYLWWEYHADSRLWFASIVMPTISMWIYFHKGIYADFAINIIITFFPMGSVTDFPFWISFA